MFNGLMALMSVTAAVPGSKAPDHLNGNQVRGTSSLLSSNKVPGIPSMGYNQGAEIYSKYEVDMIKSSISNEREGIYLYPPFAKICECPGCPFLRAFSFS